MMTAVGLRKQIVWLIALKLVLLVIIQQAFFGGEHRVHVSPVSVEQHLLDSTVSTSKQTPP